MSVAIPAQEATRRGADATAVPAVSVERLSKRFVLPHQRYKTLKERALHPLQARQSDVLRAIEDVSFEIGDGEFFGIVGRNGSGKSTLLKCLAGIYTADEGHAVVRGRLSPFIELGVGFNPELSARDNVLINAVMLGLTRRQARERFDEIIAFAELEEFLDLKLKNYSSGMSVRLAFSVAIQVDADVLMVDEVLAVGDAAFQQKCFDAFHRLKRAGKTIVFVTHDMSAVERFCDRAMLLERGRVVSIDEPHAIARKYTELNFGRIVATEGATERYGDQAEAEIKAAWFEEDGRRSAAVAQDRSLAMCVEVYFHEAVEDPWFSLHLRNDVKHTVFVSGSTMHMARSGRFDAGSTAVIRVELQNWLAPGRYYLTPTVARAGGTDVLDLREDLTSVVVHGVTQSGGVVDLPHTFSVQRS